MNLYKINPLNPHTRYISKAAEALRSGELIAYPTDINYGFACLLSSPIGVKKLNNFAKVFGRTKYHTIICKDLSDISKYANINNYAYRLMKKILPGPYTVILEATKLVPKICQTKRKTIGIRIVDNPVVNDLINILDSPLLNITALPKDKSRLLENPEDIVALYKNELSCLLDIGEIPSSRSTVIDFSLDEVQVIREGLGPVDFI